MKLSIPLLALTAVVFSSCVSAYKTGQTPDDVYFSPAREEKAQEYVQLQERDDRYYRGSDYYEDRFLRMRMTNRYRWSALDDYYFNNTYAYSPYGFYNNWYSPWNSYYAWNTFYNPYYGGIHYYPGTIIIKNPQRYTPPSRAIAFNPGSYSTNSNSRTIGSRGLGGYNNSNGTRYNNNNSNRSSFGQSVRKVFSGSNSGNNSGYNSNNSNNNNSTPTRSYTPSSSSSSQSSSGGSSSGGGGGATRPPR